MEAAVATDARELLRRALARRAGQLGCWLESTGKGHVDGTDYYLDEVIGTKDNGNWWCFSVVYVPFDHSVGVWTREMKERVQSVVSAQRTYRFDPATFDKWLDEWFENAILEQLTKP